MDQTTPSLSPRRRWWRSRKLVYIAVLVALAVCGFWLHDWLFMPADLRQLQGRWQLVRHVDGENRPHGLTGLAIVGRRLSRIGKDGEVEKSVSFDINSERREMFIVQEKEFQMFGSTVSVPVWLSRGEVRERFQFEIVDQSLRISRLSEERPELIAEFTRELP